MQYGRHPDESILEARIQNYELAARMQLAVAKELDLSLPPERFSPLNLTRRMKCARPWGERRVNRSKTACQPWKRPTRTGQTPCSASREYAVDIASGKAHKKAASRFATCGESTLVG